ncbi:MAG: GldG family protein [Chloroflexota bacterium]
MKPEWRRYAPLGLYLSGLAVLASIGLFVIQRQFNLALQISLGLIVVGLALFTLLDPDRVRRALTGRQARYGSNALLLTLGFVGILAVVNYLAFNNNKTWDLTEDKQFTLAPETVDLLGKLSEPVTAKAFFTARTPSDTARTLLDQFKQQSQGKFDYQFIDPDSDPLAAEQAGITQDGSIVLYMGQRQQSVRFASEQELAGGMVRLMNPEARTIYFLTGHGEYDPDASGDKSYAQVKRALEGKNYTVKPLNLLAAGQIPADARLIVVAGPRQPLDRTEIDLIAAYQAQGGALIAMEEPVPLTEYGDAADLLAEYLQSNWNISLGNDIVVDLTSQQPFAPYAASYGSHPITQPILRTATQFPTARSVRAAAAGGAGVSLVELVLTDQQSWAETSLQGIVDGSSEVKFDEGVDLPGPVSLAVVAENLETKARTVVFGDSDFVIDANYRAYANGDLLMNAVDWAIGQENLISLTPKDATQRMVVPPQNAVMNFIFLGTVIILPALALFGGVWTFIQRRRRG